MLKALVPQLWAGQWLLERAQKCWGTWLLSPACHLELAPQMRGEEGDYHALQTCQGFALSSFAKYSQGCSLGFNKSSTISRPESIGSALDPSCPILPLTAYALSALDSSSQEISSSPLFLGHSGQICSNGIYICSSPLT